MTHTEINFNAPATLKKYPSLNARRNPNALFANPYLLHEGTLDECIQELLTKPVSQHGLYEIHTEPQSLLVTGVLTADRIIELVRLRDFL